MSKVIKACDAAKNIKDGMTILFGGFLGCGSAETVIDAIVESGVKNLTIIGNDTSFVDKGIGKLVMSKQVSKVVVSHIGTNKETGLQMNAGEIEVVLVPQGTLIEQIRSGGSGLGGVLTPTGLGTLVEEGKEKIEIDGKTFLVEKAIRADIGLVAASKVDEKGNCYFDKTTANFNPFVALASDFVIVEAEEIVKTGDIDPHLVMAPGAVVNAIVKVGE